MGNVSTKCGATVLAEELSKHSARPAQASVTIEVQCYLPDEDEQYCMRSSLTAGSTCSKATPAWRDSSSSNGSLHSSKASKLGWNNVLRKVQKLSSSRGCDGDDACSIGPSCKSTQRSTAASDDVCTHSNSSTKMSPELRTATLRLSNSYQQSVDWAKTVAKSLQHSSRHLLPSCFKPQCSEGDEDYYGSRPRLWFPATPDAAWEDETVSHSQQETLLNNLAGQLEASETTGCTQHNAEAIQPVAASGSNSSSTITTGPNVFTEPTLPAAPVASVQAVALEAFPAEVLPGSGVVSRNSDSSTTTNIAAGAAATCPQEQAHIPASLSDSVSPQSWSFGSSSVQNARQHMEDRVVSCDLTGHAAFPGATRAGVFAVLDGHGGQAAAEYLSANIVQHILAAGADALQSRPLEALGSAIQHAEGKILSTWAPQSGPASGSTLCLGLLVDDTLHIAHVGDSRAVLARGAKSVALTRDHKPTCSIEAQRIAAVDPQAHVSIDGYLYAELGVSRGLGSAHVKADPSKAAYVATPELVSLQLEPGDDFVLLATDGLWDKVGSADAVNAARRSLAECRDPATASHALVERAQKLGSLDNISVITLLLHGRNIVLPKSNSRLFSRRALQAPVEPGTPADTGAAATCSPSADTL